VAPLEALLARESADLTRFYAASTLTAA